MSGSRRIGRMPSALQLDRRFRLALYAAFAVLFVTGVIWLAADARKEMASGEFWQAVSANLLMIHGGTAMLVLICLGALIPLHIERAWRSQRNRITGLVMAAINTLFVATAFGLYYAGSDSLRGWISEVHIAAGLIFPPLLAAHIVIGRRRAGNATQRKRTDKDAE